MVLLSFLCSFCIATEALFANPAPDTLRLLLIGNSFSQNAAQYLPQLAKEGQHVLILGRAEIGGCSLQKHWELAEWADTHPEDPKGKPYGGKSLRTILSSAKWDVVTIQQASILSSDVATYTPFARNLCEYVGLLQPEARVVMHQTWAYRSDSKDFGQIAENRSCTNAKEMWQKSREAYITTARELQLEIIPVGDAFMKASTHRKWGFRPDNTFNEKTAAYPALPLQENSLHVGYFWKDATTLSFDSHHANQAGCFLGALVWYAFLFEEPVSKLEFVPEKISPRFADFLKRTADAVVN